MEGPSGSQVLQQPSPSPLVLIQPQQQSLVTSDMDRHLEPSSSTGSGTSSSPSPAAVNVVVVSSLASVAAAAVPPESSTSSSSSSSSSAVVSSGGNSTGVITTSMEEPLKKKAKLMDPSCTGTSSSSSSPSSGASARFPEKLELRLGGILCCAVCLDLPRSAIYQCTNGHLMCAGCFTHLLADARLRDEIATCPNCRVEISKHIASRNLAVEKAVNELPAECQYCNKEFPRNTLEHHERELCEERTTSCKFHRIGCPWRGPHHELKSHQENCIHPKKSGAEVMDILRGFDMENEKDKKMYNNIFDLLSYEKINFNDLQLKPYRTDEFVHKLFYETSRFSAFNNQWVVKARINNNQKDPTQSCDRNITYQLILKTKPSTSLDVSFVILKGPFGDMKVSPAIHRFEFSEQNNESPYFNLPINETSEVNRLLAQKAVHFRLIAFLQ